MNVKPVNAYFILPFSRSLPELLWRIKGLSERAGPSRAMAVRLKQSKAGWLTLAGRKIAAEVRLERLRCVLDEGAASQLMRRARFQRSARPELENLWMKPIDPFSVILSFIS